MIRRCPAHRLDPPLSSSGGQLRSELTEVLQEFLAVSFLCRRERSGGVLTMAERLAIDG